VLWQANYRVVNASCVREFSVLSPPPEREANAPELPSMPEAKIELAKQREERAVAKAQEDGAHVCAEATAHAQSVFDALRKTMKIDWLTQKPDAPDRRPHMLVMDAVMIQPPYTPETCLADVKEKKLKERVQKVLAGTLKKLEAVGVQ
jgi:hypothetical protein